jgi:type IV pilus assembly protein PilM
MFNPLNLFFPKRMLGIDIGTSSLRMVELSRWGGGRTLENYGELQSESFYQEHSMDEANASGRGVYSLSDPYIAKAIRAVLEESRIKTRTAVFSIPDFFTFATAFDMPPMTDKEIPEAVKFNASQYITLPISEVTLDWKILPAGPDRKTSSIRVFLVAVPNQVVQEYQNIAGMCGLKLYALEPEVLALNRALIKEKKKVVCLVDIGVQSATINVIDKGFLKKSYSFNFNSSQLSRLISSTLGVGMQEAEDIKNREGLLYERQDIVKAMYLILSPLLVEIKSICSEFSQAAQSSVQEIYLTGGTASLPGLQEYVTDVLKIPARVPNCFSDILYPPILENTLRQMSPSFSPAVGAVLGQLAA